EFGPCGEGEMEEGEGGCRSPGQRQSKAVPAGRGRGSRVSEQCWCRSSEVQGGLGSSCSLLPGGCRHGPSVSLLCSPELIPLSSLPLCV
uniref:Uncharacterized protein n=1 Tax=Buteo japonicus TaxID=224669 RepID=A0A8C0ALR1_9AVES